MDNRKRIPDFLLEPQRDFTPEEKYFWSLWDEYHRRWPDGFNTITTIVSKEDEEELLHSLERCVRENIPMEQVHPEWVEWDPEHEKL